MIILLEGPDCAGKTTLARHIEKKFGFSYFKESLSYQERLSFSYDSFVHYEDTIKQIRDYIKNQKKYVVCDRFHLGEIVNPIIRKDGRKPLTPFEIKQLEKDFLRDSCLLISCLPPISFMKEKYETRGEDVASVYDIQYLLYMYSLAHNISSIKNKCIFDVSSDSDYKSIDNKITKFLKKK